MVLRSLFRHWLRSTAQRTIHEKVAEAARNQVTAPDVDTDADHATFDDRSCDVGIVFALGIEAGGLEDRLRKKTTIRGEGFVVRRGTLAGRNIVLVLSGPGETRAARATEALVDGHRPKWIISAGFAGGLDPRLQRHDVVMADSLGNARGARLAIDLKVDPAELAHTPGVHVGRFLTVDRVVRLPSEKRSLAAEHDAVAVDTESFAVAEVCRDRQVRFLAIRVVTDTVDDTLPPDVRKLAEQATRTARLGAAAGALWRRPSSFKDMWKLKENALVASDRLGKFLEETVKQL